MSLDATTLTFAGGFVTFLGGLFLLAYWWQDRAAWAAFWWALANCGLGIGITLLALHSVLPHVVRISQHRCFLISARCWRSSRLGFSIVDRLIRIV